MKGSVIYDGGPARENHPDTTNGPLFPAKAGSVPDVRARESGGCCRPMPPSRRAARAGASTGDYSGASQPHVSMPTAQGYLCGSTATPATPLCLDMGVHTRTAPMATAVQPQAGYGQQPVRLHMLANAVPLQAMAGPTMYPQGNLMPMVPYMMAGTQLRTAPYAPVGDHFPMAPFASATPRPVNNLPSTVSQGSAAGSSGSAGPVAAPHSTVSTAHARAVSSADPATSAATASACCVDGASTLVTAGGMTVPGLRGSGGSGGLGGSGGSRQGSGQGLQSLVSAEGRAQPHPSCDGRATVTKTHHRRKSELPAVRLRKVRASPLPRSSVTGASRVGPRSTSREAPTERTRTRHAPSAAAAVVATRPRPCCVQVVAFIEATGRRPTRKSANPHEKTLGVWLHRFMCNDEGVKDRARQSVGEDDFETIMNRIEASLDAKQVCLLIRHARPVCAAHLPNPPSTLAPPQAAPTCTPTCTPTRTPTPLTPAAALRPPAAALPFHLHKSR